MQDLFERFQRRYGGLVPAADKPFVMQALDDAADFVCGYTNRKELMQILYSDVVELAVIAYNKRGAEGETSRSEGGISRSFEAVPEHIRAHLNAYRKVGAVYETDAE